MYSRTKILKSSAAGTRTRVSTVRASYDNHLHYSGSWPIMLYLKIQILSLVISNCWDLQFWLTENQKIKPDQLRRSFCFLKLCLYSSLYPGGFMAGSARVLAPKSVRRAFGASRGFRAWNRSCQDSFFHIRCRAATFAAARGVERVATFSSSSCCCHCCRQVVGVELGSGVIADTRNWTVTMSTSARRRLLRDFRR